MIKALILTGPTASGKTELSLELAERLGGEIICCDSMQVYKHMDIGTAKPSREEQRRVPHYMLDVAEPWEDFNVASYCKMATAAAEKVAGQGKLPIFVGGTGLYVTSLKEGFLYREAPEENGAVRELLQQISLEADGPARLHSQLSQADPEAAAEIHPNNVKRVIRALELYQLTGKTRAERNAVSRDQNPVLDCTVFAVQMDRALLYDRINRRVDMMLNQGLVEEVQRIIAYCRETCPSVYETEPDFPRNCTSFQAIGYKEPLQYLMGDCSFEEMTEQIKSATRKYAKRQLTWLRKWSWVNWLDMDTEKAPVSRILSHLSEHADDLSQNN